MQTFSFFLEAGATDYPEAMIAVGGITMVTVIVAVALWQVFASYRAKVSVTREDAYRRLAEESITAHRQAGDGLRDTATKLTQLEQRTSELERLLKEVG
jgi:hypothetical protein